MLAVIEPRLVPTPAINTPVAFMFLSFLYVDIQLYPHIESQVYVAT